MQQNATECNRQNYMTDYRTQQQADALWRAIEANVDKKIAAALKIPTGITPGTAYGSVIFDAAGRATWGGAGGGGASLIASYWTDSIISIASGSYVVVDFANETHDPDGLVTTGSPWALTIPANGKYQIVAKVRFVESGSGWSAGNHAEMWIHRNGFIDELIDYLDDPQNATLNNVLSGNVVDTFLQDDTIAIALFQSSGTTKQILGARYECRFDLYRWT
jgi:hypothetical protein